MVLIQVGPGDGYKLTVELFDTFLSTLGDSMITKNRGFRMDEMKFTTR